MAIKFPIVGIAIANIIASINRIDSKPSGTVTNEQISTAVNNYLTEVEGRVRDAVEKDIERRKTFKLSAS